MSPQVINFLIADTLTDRVSAKSPVVRVSSRVSGLSWMSVY
ncbi:MAG: hypothetical protein OXM00_04085 [Paracoccaceae bacterium]|nr:hypothetical protein [Paracoccaceae bacterium]